MTRTLLLLLILFIFIPESHAHCQVPCGIYDDSLRIELIKEHIRTVEKSMRKIEELGKEKDVNYNQLIRWTVNRDEHADKIMNIIAQYFMAQRIKPCKDGEEKKSRCSELLTVSHKIMYYAMKAKQSTDKMNIEKLRKYTETLEKIYFHSH
ncbi:MAG: superoxide dismutase [Ni] [Fibrobacterota bacterium]